MKDIDEAIRHCEEVMMENIEKTKNRNATDPVAHNCFECADNHRQLAELLKELKRHREAWQTVKEKIDTNKIAYMSDSIYEEGVRFGLMLAYQVVDKALGEVGE